MKGQKNLLQQGKQCKTWEFCKLVKYILEIQRVGARPWGPFTQPALMLAFKSILNRRRFKWSGKCNNSFQDQTELSNKHNIKEKPLPSLYIKENWIKNAFILIKFYFCDEGTLVSLWQWLQVCLWTFIFETLISRHL